MLYDSEQEVRGINTLRFVIDPANFDVIPENEGFCVPDNTSCLPRGLLNIERCFGMLLWNQMVIRNGIRKNESQMLIIGQWPFVKEDNEIFSYSSCLPN